MRRIVSFAVVALVVLLCGTAWAGNPYRHYRLDNVGGACVSTGGSTITTASASPPAIQTAATTTQPFLTTPSANTCIVGVHGVYGAAAIDNLVQRSSFETWAAGSPTGWLSYEVAGNGTSSITEETTIVAHGSSAVKITLTNTTSQGQLYGNCTTSGIGADLYASTWAKDDGSTTDFNFFIREYDAADCTSALGNIQLVVNQDLTSSWAKYGGLVAAGAWNASTSSWRVFAYEEGDGGVTTYVDAVQARAASTPTDAYCGCDTDATCSCSAYIHSIPSPISANGTVQIEATLQTPWAGSDQAATTFLYTDGNAGANNTYALTISSSRDEPSWVVYDNAGDLKYNNHNVANWAADTSYTVKVRKTSGGSISTFWNSSWQTSTATTGSATGTRQARQSTMYICGTQAAPSDCWIKELKFFRRLVGQ